MLKSTDVICFHCGNAVTNKALHMDDKYFCCSGCQMVYEILNQNDLCNYYNLNDNPGLLQNINKRKEKFEFLDLKEVQNKLLNFSSLKQCQVIFYLPQIHCSSCLWLLENISGLNKGILSSRVDFLKKEVFIAYDPQKTNLRKVVETLDSIGYEPHLSLNDLDIKVNKTNHSLLYKIGIAGFCFGNIMMMSLADYFSFSSAIEPKIGIFFKILSLILSLPVLFYSATEFFKSAWIGLKNKILNIDFPVSLALVITFIRSLYELFANTGNGYLDSLTGIVFFMLIGRWLQARTYKTISFDRDYRSFFPIALNVVKNGEVSQIELSKLKENDVIQVYSNDVIPVDSILSKGVAQIDYSFVNGESLPVQVNIGELIYAGGRQLGGQIELLVVKVVAQSYLTNLWNNSIFNKSSEVEKDPYDTIGKYFTALVVSLGFVAGLYWYIQGKEMLMWNSITTVLIVACPCALLLSRSFTYGNILRIFSLHKFYLRAPHIIERISKIDHIVFDKTGTITQIKGSNVIYSGKILSTELRVILSSLLKQSSHPKSKIVANYLNVSEEIEIKYFKETLGNGIEGWINEKHIKIGSPDFIDEFYKTDYFGSKLRFSIDGEIFGEFSISNKYRFGISNLIQRLKKNFSISLLSGDNESETKNIESIFGQDNEIYFNQSPTDKLDHIIHLQKDEQLNVMMVGDGLNDSSALKQSDVGIAIADKGTAFTPSSDGVLDSSKLKYLDKFIHLAKAGKLIILSTFILSVIYNLIGLYYALQGVLSPVIAAILMPASSITIILLSYGLTKIMGDYYFSKVKISEHVI